MNNKKSMFRVFLNRPSTSSNLMIKVKAKNKLEVEKIVLKNYSGWKLVLGVPMNNYKDEEK